MTKSTFKPGGPMRPFEAGQLYRGGLTGIVYLLSQPMDTEHSRMHLVMVANPDNSDAFELGRTLPWQDHAHNVSPCGHGDKIILEVN